MPDETINVGDMVAVVQGHPCCGEETQYLGLVTTVIRIEPPGYLRCIHCFSLVRNWTDHLYILQGADGAIGFARSELQKIHPPNTTIEEKEDDAIPIAA